MSIASCFTSSRIINSFGAKPERGGRPARDKRASMMVVARAGALGQEVKILVILVADRVERERNTAAVIKM